MNTDDILDAHLHGETIDKNQNAIPVELTSPNRYILFHVLSMGLYSIWYMYYIWDFFRTKHRADVMPFLRAIFGLIFFYPMCEKIQRFSRLRDYPEHYSSGVLFAGFIIFALMSYLPDPAWIFGIFSFFVFIPPIKAFNFTIDNSKEYIAIYKTDYSALQIILMFVGAIIWILAMIGTFMPEPTGYSY